MRQLKVEACTSLKMNGEDKKVAKLVISKSDQRRKEIKGSTWNFHMILLQGSETDSVLTCELQHL